MLRQSFQHSQNNNKQTQHSSDKYLANSAAFALLGQIFGTCSFSVLPKKATSELASLFSTLPLYC